MWNHERRLRKEAAQSLRVFSNCAGVTPRLAAAPFDTIPSAGRDKLRVPDLQDQAR